MKVCVNVGSMFYKNLNLILLYYFYPDIAGRKYSGGPVVHVVGTG